MNQEIVTALSQAGATWESDFLLLLELVGDVIARSYPHWSRSMVLSVAAGHIHEHRAAGEVAV